jgi:hypothetical protein
MLPEPPRFRASNEEYKEAEDGRRIVAVDPVTHRHIYEDEVGMVPRPYNPMALTLEQRQALTQPRVEFATPPRDTSPLTLPRQRSRALSRPFRTRSTRRRSLGQLQLSTRARIRNFAHQHQMEDDLIYDMGMTRRSARAFMEQRQRRIRNRTLAAQQRRRQHIGRYTDQNRAALRRLSYLNIDPITHYRETGSRQ